jgi:hypothetical protein
MEAFATVKIAVFAPIPSARVTIAATAGPGALRNIRRAHRISPRRFAM